MTLPLSRTDAPDPGKLALGMAAALGLMGAVHFAAPKPFDAIVPEQLPGGQRLYTYASGVAELGTAALLAAPQTRRAGGLAAMLVFIGVYPANIYMAVQWWHKPLPMRLIALARLPLQIPMILAARRVWRHS